MSAQDKSSNDQYINGNIDTSSGMKIVAGDEWIVYHVQPKQLVGSSLRAAMRASQTA